MRRITVLIVDDHEGFINAAVRHLRNVAWVEIIGRAFNGLEAVEASERLRPDVVLMDLAMPEMGGLQATRLIKAQDAPPFVAIASHFDDAEHRGSFSRVLSDTGLPAPAHGTATTFAEAREIAARIGYPVLVRPSYVLGGRGMEIVYDDATLEGYIVGRIAVEAAYAAQASGRLSRARFGEVLAGLKADLGGFRVDFGGGSQGSRFVDLIALDRYGRLVG